MIDIVGKRYWFFGLSLLVIIPGMIALHLWGSAAGDRLHRRQPAGAALPLGGTLPSTEDVVGLYAEAGVADPTVQSVGTDGLLIRSKTMEDAVKGQIVAALAEPTGAEVVVQRFESVGPAVGAEVAQRAAFAVGAGRTRHPALHLVCLPPGRACLPLRRGGHHRHAARRAGGHRRRGHPGPLPGLGGRLAVPDGAADRDRLLGARHDRRVRPHPREPAPASAAELRDARQSLDRPDARPVDQHAADGHVHAAGAAALRRRDDATTSSPSC